MTEPGRHEALPLDDDGRDRTLLARKWSYLLTGKAFIPTSHDDLERELSGLVDELCADLAGTTVERSRSAGARLVELQCVGPDVLECTVDVLCRGLAALAPDRADRVSRCVGALAAGFLDTDRTRLLAQQESMHMSLLAAVREAKWNLLASEARFDQVATASASGIMITDLDGRLVRVNAAVCAILERDADELTGLALFDVVHPDYAEALREDYAALVAGRTERLKQSQQLMREDGDYARVTLTASLLRGEDGTPSHFVTVVEDGTELVLLRNELSRQALHDVLTGLPNRQFFASHLEGALRRTDKHGITLLHLSLDAFASIAHGFGRRAAEQVLVTVARRLTTFAAGAMVAHFDGDEFAVLRENTADSPPVSALVADLRRALDGPVKIDGTTVAVTVGVGVVDRPRAGSGPEDVLRAAEFALRRAKARGPGQFERYDPADDDSERRAHALAASMAAARDSGQIGLGYRPVSSLATDEVVGLEARLRWDHPGLGPIGHDRCVELAERTGLVLSLGAWLLRTAADQLRWRRTAYPLLVSVSAHQTRDSGLVGTVADTLATTGMEPGRLRLGLPARTLSDGHGHDTVTALADQGVRIVLDGFTLGDLPLLEDLPASAVRVLSSLAARRDSAMSSALADLPALAHRTSATVIVDGVTSATDTAWWRSAGADEATGDFVGAPV